MTGASAPVGHDGTGALHHWLPVGIGHVGDQHVPRLHHVHLVDVVDQAHRTRTNFLTNGTALGQHRARGLELEAVLHLVFLLAFHGLWAGLQNVNLPIHAVLAPFDVHRSAIVGFDDQGIIRQLLHFIVGQ